MLTGGGSQIPGLDGLASKILGHQVRLGRPLRVHGLPQAATGAGFSSAVGMCLFAANPQDEWWDFEIPQDRYPARSLKRAVKWFRGQLVRMSAMSEVNSDPKICPDRQNPANRDQKKAIFLW